MRALAGLLLLLLGSVTPAWADFSITPMVWTQLTTGTSPSFRAYGSVTWDRHNRWFWWFAGRPGDEVGGDNGVNNTTLWSFDPSLCTGTTCPASAWTMRWNDGNVVAPVTGGAYPRRRHSYGHFDYMPDRAKILLHGGVNHGLFTAQTDTWEWDVRTLSWTERSGGSHGNNREESETMYHPGLRRAIAFGGLQGPSSTTPNEYNPDTGNWTLRGQTSNICPITWSNGMLLYDQRRDRVVLWGGTCDYESTSLSSNEMYAYNATAGTWAVVPVTGGKPGARNRTSFAYDSIHDLYLVYGGTTQGGSAKDTWVFNPSGYAKYGYPANGWTNITSTVGQPGHMCSEYGIAFAPEYNAFLMVQGSSASNDCFGQGQTHRLYALRLVNDQANYLTFDGGSDRTLPGWCYAANARQGQFAGFQEGTCVANPIGEETSRWMHLFPWDNDERNWQYIQLTTTATAKGSSGALEIVTTGGRRPVACPPACDYNNGAQITSKEEFLASPGNVGTGQGGQPYFYLIRRGGNQTLQAQSANRLSLYLYVPPGQVECFESGGLPCAFDYQIVQNHCDPAQNPCTSGRGSISEGEPTTGGHGHFYHYVKAPKGGGWYHVLLDRHPQLLRNTPATPVDNPTAASSTWGNKDYYDTLALLYIDGTSGSFTTGLPMTTPFTNRVDEVHFYREPLPENIDTIKSVSVGYLPEGNGTWWLGFNGSEGNPDGTWEVRYSTSPITNDLWASATPVTVIGPQAVPGCSGCTRKQRIDSGYGAVVVNFDLPSAREAAGARTYFAIKDISQTGQHANATFGADNRTSTNSNVHTIDYIVPGAAGAPPPTPAAPAGLTVRQP